MSLPETSGLGRGGGSGRAGTRTQDQLVKSQLLYQLSYLSVGYRIREVRTGQSGDYTDALGSRKRKFDEKIAQVLLVSPDAEVTESGGLGSGPVADGIIADVEDRGGRDAEALADSPEEARIGLGEALFAREEKGFEGIEQPEVGEDAAEAGIEIRENDAPVGFGDAAEDLVRPRFGEPSAGLLEAEVEGVKKGSVVGLVGEGDPGLGEDGPDETTPPSPFVGIIGGVWGSLGKGRRGALPDRPEGMADRGGIRGHAVFRGDTSVGDSDRLGEMDEGAGSIEADDCGRIVRHGVNRYRSDGKARFSTNHDLICGDFRVV